MKERPTGLMLIATIFLAPLLLQGCSPSLPDQEAETPSSLEMEFHRLKVEPVVYPSYPTY